MSDTGEGEQEQEELLIQDRDILEVKSGPSYSGLTAFGLCINMIVGTGVFKYVFIAVVTSQTPSFDFKRKILF